MTGKEMIRAFPRGSGRAATFGERDARAHRAFHALANLDNDVTLGGLFPLESFQAYVSVCTAAHSGRAMLRRRAVSWRPT